MKKFLFSGLCALALAGCHQKPSAPTAVVKPARVATPMARPNMDKRLALIFPGAQIEKLPIPQKGEYYAATKGGTVVGRAALLTDVYAKGRMAQILLATAPNGTITLIAAGVPRSAGMTPDVAALNAFLQQMKGKNILALQRVSPAGLPKDVADRAHQNVMLALVLLSHSAR